MRNIISLATIKSLITHNRPSVSEPLEEIERDLVAATRDHIAKLSSEYRMLEERKVRLEKEASRADNSEERQAKAAEAVRVAQQLAAMKVSNAPRLLISDATSEVVSTVLAEQGGRIVMLSTEGGIFETMAGRYSNGVPNIDVYLKGNSGDTLRVDRRRAIRVCGASRADDWVDRSTGRDRRTMTG